MSLAVAIKGPQGIVLAADRRRTLLRPDIRIEGAGTPYLTCDDELKLHTFAGHPWVAAAFCGRAVGVITSFAELASDIEAALSARRLSLREYAEVVSKVAAESKWGRVTGLVAGVDEPGELCLFYVETGAEPVEQHAGALGMTWIGTRDIIDRLIQGHDPRLTVVGDVPAAARMNIPFATMSLEDCAKLAMFLIRTTQGGQGFSADRVSGVGGAIDVAAVVADGVHFERQDLQACEPELRLAGPPPAARLTCPSDFSRPSTHTVPCHS